VPPEELLELLELEEDELELLLEEELDELLDDEELELLELLLEELEPSSTVTDELTTSLPPARLIITA